MEGEGSSSLPKKEEYWKKEGQDPY